MPKASLSDIAEAPQAGKASLSDIAEVVPQQNVPQSWSQKLGLQNPLAVGAVDLAEGAASGAASTLYNGGDLIRRGLGMNRVIDTPEAQQAMRAPDSLAGKTGKFLEQAAEFAIPATKATNLTKGASLLAKVGAQAAVGGATAAVQTGGNPAATGAAAAMGAAGPLLKVSAPAVAQKIGITPEKLYQSALKPTWSMFKKDGGEMIKTGLREGIPVSSEGMEMLESKIDSIGKQITQGITNRSAMGAKVDSSKVLNTLTDLENWFRNTAAPKEALDTLQNLRDEFAQYHGVPMSLADAQKVKVNTYALLKQAYGEMKSAKVEGLKQIARGLKDQISTVWPEVAQLNEQQSKLLGLDDALYRAVWRIENHQMMGIGSPIAAAAGNALVGKPGAVTGFLGKLVLDNPTLKSKLAIALAQAGNRAPSTAIQNGLAALKATAQETTATAAQPAQ